MDTREDEQIETTDEPFSSPPGRVERARDRAAAWRERAKLLEVRAVHERQQHESVDAVFEMADHDSEVGGGIMAGALAYRFFIWLLPLALVGVAGLGIAADASSNSPESAARSMGLLGLVSDSVASAAESSARWYAILIGIPLLVYATRSLLRTLIVTHRLVWGDLRRTAPKPKLSSTLQLLAAMIGFFVISGLAVFARGVSGIEGLFVTLLIPVPYAVLWLLVSMRLPHRDAPWRALLPGAVVVGIGIELFHIVTAYLIAPRAGSKQSTYGSLGVAAALLLGLYLLSRLVIGAAVVNAILWQRHSAGAHEPPSDVELHT